MEYNDDSQLSSENKVKKFQDFDYLKWSEWFDNVLRGKIVEPVLPISMYDIPKYIIAAYDESQKEKNVQDAFFDGLIVCFNDLRVNDSSIKIYFDILDIFKQLPLKTKYLSHILSVIKSRKYITTYYNNFTLHQELIDVYFYLSKSLTNRVEFEKILIEEISHYHITRSFGIFSVAINYYKDKGEKVELFKYFERIIYNDILVSEREKRLIINKLFDTISPNDIFIWLKKNKDLLEKHQVLSIIKLKIEQLYKRNGNETTIEQIYYLLNRNSFSDTEAEVGLNIEDDISDGAFDETQNQKEQMAIKINPYNSELNEKELSELYFRDSILREDLIKVASIKLEEAA